MDEGGSSKGSFYNRLVLFHNSTSKWNVCSLHGSVLSSCIAGACRKTTGNGMACIWQGVSPVTRSLTSPAVSPHQRPRPKSDVALFPGKRRSEAMDIAELPRHAWTRVGLSRAGCNPDASSYSCTASMHGILIFFIEFNRFDGSPMSSTEPDCD